MQSMTGFGKGMAQLGAGRIVIELKSVNHRFLEIRSRVPRELLAAEARIEQLLRKRLSRGYLTVNVSYEGDVGGSAALNTGAVRHHLAAIEKLSIDTGLPVTSLVPMLTAAPDLYVNRPVEDESGVIEATCAAANEACSQLLAMRSQEGQAMRADLDRLLAGIARSVDRIEEHAARVPEAVKTRLLERIASLTAQSDVAVDAGRLETEVALLADKADITEEVVRLRSHIEQMGRLWDETGPVGRKMEFLLQEMGRESNTIGAKSALSEILTLGVDIKAELEKMRELAQNVE